MRKITCIRCGRRFKGVALCLDCDLFIGRQTLPGVKRDALRKAHNYLRSGGLQHTRNTRVFGARSKSIQRMYKTWSRGCTCPSGLYRGLRGPSCYHSWAVQLISIRKGS